ncbi:hypothetical protein GQ457_13G016160 [Hibiscus cannabinus]
MILWCEICPTKLGRRRLSCSAKIIRHCSIFEVRRLSCSAKIIRHYLIFEVGKKKVLTLSTDEGQDDTGLAILKDDTGPASFEKVRRLSCSVKIIRHYLIFEVGKKVLTLSTDEGQDDTGPAILKRSGRKVLTLSTDKGQDDTGPTILKRSGRKKIIRHTSILEVLIKVNLRVWDNVTYTIDIWNPEKK